MLLTLNVKAIDYRQEVTLNWNDIQTNSVDGQSYSVLSFDDAIYHSFNGLPYFYYTSNIHSSDVSVSGDLIDVRIVEASAEEAELLINMAFANEEFIVTSRVSSLRKQPVVVSEILPIRLNKETGIYEKLVEGTIVSYVTDKVVESGSKGYASTSVLASGNWHKIKLNESGIYKITYADLEVMGFDLGTSPANFALYGNGGALLPEKNDDFRYDDLEENPVVIVGGDDGSWNNGDYVLFYGEGPVTWSYNAIENRYYHHTNYYRDYTYYLITVKSTAGKRISNQTAPSSPANMEVSDFTDYIVHELTEVNIAGVGRTWYGETFDYDLDYYYDFDFPNIIKQEGSASFNLVVAAKSYAYNAFRFSANDNLLASLSVPVLSPTGRYEYGKSASRSDDFTPDDDQLVVHIEYVRSSSTSVGYLDYFEINAQRELIFDGDQMMFRKYIDDNNAIIKYDLSNVNDNTIVWDITTPVAPEKVVTQQSGSSLSFKADNNKHREYIAYNNNGDFLSVEYVGEVANQDLHGYRNIDYLIVTYPDFIDQANELADFHRTNSDLSVLVATTDQIYNEFSSGGQDITAIRDFAKMLYDDSDSGSELRYLLLFGDASYDYKDILSDNTNFVPCWESVNSLNIVLSIATDDYYGFLDDGEGVDGSEVFDLVDIGIGRFVVSTVDEAQSAVNKTKDYKVNTMKNMGPWRNIVTFIADDGDNNRHISDAEYLAEIFDTSNLVYNVSKIYTDAYEQISTPSGQRAPSVNKAINDRIEKGTLIFNYSGHGGEIGLGHEQIVQIQDINSWTNYDMLSVFITATCEFTRYDDPTRVSAGEYVFLNQNGGGIALFTTTRATYASANLALNRSIYVNNMFLKIDGKYPAFGDIIRRSKKYGTDNDKKFILVGDPACQMVYPDYNAETVKINSNVVMPNMSDTIKALQLVSIEGITTDRQGAKLDNYNGQLYISVYDKKSKIETYGDESSSYSFYVRNNILFNGRASIINGEFEFEFMVPRDIAYKYGFGKISYYFDDQEIEDVHYDGNGYYDNIIVGGFDTTAIVDDQGPEIRLFMNDTSFISGEIVNQNPNLLAFISDSSGINTTGIGIGHDIVSVINEDKEMTYVLNDYYEASENKYNQGKVVYPFSSLPAGKHTLSLKVWDVYNNSSTAYIDFEVVESDKVIISKLMNYPNPFMNETNFVFTHNQKGREVEVIFEIFSTDGRKVKSMKTVVTPDASQSEPVVWNGDTDDGGKIAPGFYIFRAIVKNEQGATGTDSSKLIYVR